MINMTLVSFLGEVNRVLVMARDTTLKAHNSPREKVVTMAAGKKSEGSDDDDVKRKFREALDRKKAVGHRHPQDDAGASAPAREESAKTQRIFRRKSG